MKLRNYFAFCLVLLFVVVWSESVDPEKLKDEFGQTPELLRKLTGTQAELDAERTSGPSPRSKSGSDWRRFRTEFNPERLREEHADKLDELKESYSRSTKDLASQLHENAELLKRQFRERCEENEAFCHQLEELESLLDRDMEHFGEDLESRGSKFPNVEPVIAEDVYAKKAQEVFDEVVPPAERGAVKEEATEVKGQADGAKTAGQPVDVQANQAVFPEVTVQEQARSPQSKEDVRAKLQEMRQKANKMR